MKPSASALVLPFAFRRLLPSALCGLASLFLLSPSWAGAGAGEGRLSYKNYVQRPKLVVVVVIDQFRADYLTRFRDRFLKTGGKTPGGFNYLLTKGAYFPFAQHDVLQNMTCPGHAAILTGSLPYATHISLNDYYDVAKQRLAYCSEDESSPLVGAETKTPEEAVSPRNLRTSTVGDELKNAGLPSRVMTVSLKDRAAIMLGGHRADLALWFDTDSFKWVSSKYYLPKNVLPDWVNRLNLRVHAKKSGKYLWASSGAPSGLSTDADMKPFNREISYQDKDALGTPAGIELTTDAALEMLREYKLGRGAGPDLLAVSYSSHDILGHALGPNSREMEEMTVAEDRSLNRLFEGVNAAVPGGIKNAIIVLTADHGMAPASDYAQKAGFDAAPLRPAALVKKFNAALAGKFGEPKNHEWIVAFQSLNFYLNREELEARKIAAREVETELKNLLLKEHGVEAVFTRADFSAGTLPAGTQGKQILTSYVSEVNGDVVAIPSPFVYIGDHPTHMTGYSYDRSVPLLISGPRIRPGVYAGEAHVIDLAPTLSFLLGVLAPATSDGHVLANAIGD